MVHWTKVPKKHKPNKWINKNTIISTVLMTFLVSEKVFSIYKTLSS